MGSDAAVADIVSAVEWMKKQVKVDTERIYIIGGSIPELAGENVYNTCYVYGRNGQQIAKHRKIHLFDIDVVGGQRFKESDTFSP
ncbi:MAG: carbon-nitrogen hydrolase family protein, partial [Lentisphaeria bacterium]|nr:carbon-nitrogen hydrolase family protein [Lentisphaeria bacterium]